MLHLHRGLFFLQQFDTKLFYLFEGKNPETCYDNDTESIRNLNLIALSCTFTTKHVKIV